MTSRKAMWAGMDKLEGKKEGSSYAHLEKEKVRQGYGKAKSKALENVKHDEMAKKNRTALHRENAKWKPLGGWSK